MKLLEDGFVAAPVATAAANEELFTRPITAPVENVVQFYDDATQDYAHWSRDLNMHVGFFRWGMNPFDRDALLEQLNQEVAARLELDRQVPAAVVDLGCGTGAVGRSIARAYPRAAITGISITRSQVVTANELNRAAGLYQQMATLHGDFTALPLESHSVDGVWAVESACYATGPAKEDLIREMGRVLKPGGRFVIADCFVKDRSKPLDPLSARCYRTACRSWALAEMTGLEEFTQTLTRHDFVDIKVEDISWQVAPSVAHAPFAVLSFVVKQLLAGRRLGQQSRNNLKASLLAVILGLNRSKFRYCIVSGRSGGAHIPNSPDVR